MDHVKTEKGNNIQNNSILSAQMSKRVQYLRYWTVLYFWPVFNWLKNKKKTQQQKKWKNIQCTYTYSLVKS